MRISALLLAAALAVFPITSAYAGYNGPGSAQTVSAQHGGFNGPGAMNVTKAADVEKAYDDAIAVLEGNIVEQVGKNRYIFKDASGTVLVKIMHKYFYGASITPQTRVRLSGEVDKDTFERTKVDVKRLEIIK